MKSYTSTKVAENPELGVRNSRESMKHRKVIRRIAFAYDREGYEVEADHIKEFETPETCVVMRPDIRARKDGKEIIVEVESENSLGSRRDKMQRHEFSDWAKKGKNRDFRRETVI